MSEAPERIWIQANHIPENVALDNWTVEPDADEAHLFVEYVRADRIEELEAKLAKAVEAGKTMDDGCDCQRCNQARATLAELTGGKP